jgi:hypothetical protein
MIPLKEELLKLLKNLPQSNRDMRTLAVCCNPNFSRGSDESVRKELRNILIDMENKNEVIQEKKKYYNILKTVYSLT